MASALAVTATATLCRQRSAALKCWEMRLPLKSRAMDAAIEMFFTADKPSRMIARSTLAT